MRCPVHKGGEEQHKSMLVSLVDGHFKCLACGVKGGDIIALHRLVTGLGFRDAVRDLGGRFHDE
jgi:DNA primase